MQTFQRRFIELAVAKQALAFGRFELKSGRISPYFFNAGRFCDGGSLAVLGECYAAAIIASAMTFDFLFGPAYKGIPLVAATAVALAEHHGRDLPWCFNRKEAKDHGEGGVLVGAPARGRALIVAVNKTDLVRGATALRALDRRVRDAFGFAAYAPVQFVSARSGRGVPELLRAVWRVHQAYNRRVPTAELNRFLETTVERHSPPLYHSKPVRFLYGAQTGVRPPSFVFFTSRPEGVHPSYVRYLENQLRERYGFDGCPVRLRFRRGRAERQAR